MDVVFLLLIVGLTAMSLGLIALCGGAVWRKAMMYSIAGVCAGLLLVYLVVSLLKPEWF